MGNNLAAPAFEQACKELNKSCVYKNSGLMARGDMYSPQQLWVTFPWMENLYFKAERDYDPEPVLDQMKNNNYYLPVTAVVLYVIFLVVGPKLVKPKDGEKPKENVFLKYCFAYWNLFLSIFSFYGVSRTVPHLLYRLSTETFEETVCKSAHVGYGGGTAGLAVQIFILSKIPELLDTVFLILLRKEVIFLHWYHHITVLLYCWNSYVTESAAGLWFVAMNYSVHSVMYLYFYLQTVNCIPKWFKPYVIVITMMQIMQMFVGTSIVLACMYFGRYSTKQYKYKFSGPGPCGNSDANLWAGGIMYASYLFLFVAFAFRRFALSIDDFSKKKASAVLVSNQSFSESEAAANAKASSKKQK